MQRAIMYFSIIALVSGRPDLDSQTSSKPTGSNENMKSPTTKREIPTATFAAGCFYEGKWYPHESEISRGYDGKSWCYGAYCDQTGQVVMWDNFGCSTTTVTPTTPPERPTTSPPSPTPAGCFYNGRWFLPGSDISRGSSYGWCYGMYCDAEGNIIAWDDWRCSTTSRPTTTPTAPSHLTTLRPLGCYFRGWLYDLGSEISQAWISGERCYGKRCSDDGQLITWLAFDQCHSGRDHFQTKINGCWHSGHFYRHGMEIFRKQSSEKCFEGTCEKNALINWQSISCNKERQFLAGQRRMCSYRGQLYPKGSIISSRSLYKSRGFGWCVGIKCGRNRRIITWGPAWLPGYC